MAGLRLGIVSKLLVSMAAEPPKPEVTTKVDWVSGASMILRRSLLEEIGLLDEGLYTYFDDIDICLRAKRAGWETWYVVESSVVHLGGASTGVTPKMVKRRPDYWFQARRRFFLKSYGRGLHRPGRCRIYHWIFALAADGGGFSARPIRIRRIC